MSSQQPVVFAPAFEALNRAFTLDRAARDQLLAQGIDFDNLTAAAPLSTFLLALDLAAGTLGSLGTPTTRYRLLGRAYVKGWIGTKIGLATVTIGKLLGPKRSLLRMQQTFRTSSNYVETEATVQPRTIELIVRAGADYVPHLPQGCGRLIDYRHGLLEGLLEQFGVNDSVDVVERDDDQAKALYRIRW